MTTLLVIVSLIIIFVVAVASPRRGSKIEQKVSEKAAWLKQASERFWNPVTWWLQTSLEFIRLAIAKVVAWGKSLRRKLPF